MSKNGFDKVMQVWDSRNRIIAPSKKEQLMEIINQVALPFAAGSFYYFVFDLYNYKFELISESTREVLGYEPKNFSFEKVFEILHPEDLEKMNEKETIVFDFLLNRIKVEDIPFYKVAYLLRFKHIDGNYRTILHQSKAISISKDGKIQKTICVHTDVTHINLPIDHKISFISPTLPSYFSVETTGINKFIENKFRDSFSAHELEIIRSLAEGNSAIELADLLNLSPHTINTHKKNILRKTECKNTIELIAKCIREGII